ncbi:hypothetical protein SD71_17425 [Cohnella kolymensis]|uniref:Uncharacterized protein n=1 Tax=Cohnella kolymensis TaxID=1590652 RepID=A0ABR5A2E0_9BACL|nr:hypothetical protein [Cohnella kolymensis]KIL34803.1 hypothetical protein SD71_17425 [Cohnella kolymensis]
MKLRVVPLTLTAALSVALLFGGWFTYRHYGVEQPLDRIANGVPGVESAHVAMTSDLVKVDVKLKPDADLSEVYRQIKTQGENEIGGKQLELSVTGNSAEKLDKAWGYALFDVAEAMENRRYSGVRDAMDKLAEKFPGLTANTSIDEDNVYISMRDGASAKFVILPRQPATLGVWPNA